MSTRQEGTVLIGVAVMAMIAFACSGFVLSATLEYARSEGYFRIRNERDHRVTRAVAAGASLLTTGRPASDPVEYIVQFVDDGGGEHYCTVRYSRGENARYSRGKRRATWLVEGRPSTEHEVADLPLLPSSF